MKRLFFILALVITTFHIHAQSDTKFGKEVIKMIEISGGEKVFKMVLNEVLLTAQQTRPDIPEDAWEEVESEFSHIDKTEFYNIIIPIYQRHFSLDEIEKINDFLDSDIGKKFSSKVPVISEESIEAARIWGLTIAMEISDKLKEKGY